MLANDAADDLLPVIRERDVAEAPVDNVLLLEVGAGGLSLDAAGAGALVVGDEDDVGEGRGAGEGRGGVELVLQEQAEFVALGFPCGAEEERAVRGEGGVVFGVEAVGEGGRSDGQVRDVDVVLVGGGGAGDEDAVGADGLEAGKVVEADRFQVWAWSAVAQGLGWKGAYQGMGRTQH